MIDMKLILKQHPSCLNSRASFKSVLLDNYPTEKRMVNILTILFECGIASKIKAKKSINANEMQSLILQIENDYGIAGKFSQDAILVWAAAFDVTVSAINTKTAGTSSIEAIPPAENKPIVYVEGDVDDYDVIKKADGYYIAHFNGFEEEEMTIPSLIDGKKIKGIAQDAFKGCVTVKKMCISEGIEVIEDRAFQDCKTLETISLPDTLKRIGSGTSEYGSGAFAHTNLKEVVIPQGVYFIGPHTFSYCTNLRTVVLSDKLSTICKNTFYFCCSLTTVKLPQLLSVIESEAFCKCKALKEVQIPIGTKQIEANAFKDTTLSAVYIPPTVVKIGDENNTSVWGDETFGSYLSHGKLTIYCAAGSTAMEYARKNNIKCAKAQF